MSTKLVPPTGFAYHNNKIIRGSYPVDSGNVAFIANMGIRKFVSIGVGFPGEPERNHGRLHKIELIHFPVHSGFSQDKPYSDAIDYMLTKNPDSRFYIYDDNGYSFVGIFCAILRRIEGWDTPAAIEECMRFFPSGKMPASQIRFIDSFDISKWR